MQKKYLTSIHGYEIPLLMNIPDQPEMIVMASPGFTSSKDDGLMQMLLNNLPAVSIGVVANDFPCHGESRTTIEELRLGNCMDDLTAIETMICKEYPDVPIGYFGCSFGGFMNLYYLATRPHKGSKAFYCSAALNMPDLLGTPTEETQKTGLVLTPEDPPFYVCLDFYKEMQTADLPGNFHRNDMKIMMIYGGQDDEVPPELTRTFAQKHGMETLYLEKEGHYLNGEGVGDIILEAMLDFYQD